MTKPAKQAKSVSPWYVMTANNSINGAAGKPFNKVTFSVIRALRDVNPLVNVCIEILKHQIVHIPYKIYPKDKSDASEYAEEIDYVTNLFDFPNPTDDRNNFLLKLIEDILTIDRGVVENVFNSKGEVVQLWPVDGATIKPCFDEYGIFKEPAYVQYVNDLTAQEADATFEEDEIDVLINSPLSQTDMMGYGKSPIERILLTVITSINAENFNAQAFDKNTLPPYMVNLPNATEEQILALRQQWEGKMQKSLWSGIFISAPDVKIEKLRESNMDMQFHEQVLWLSKIIIAAFEMTPQDIGLTMDINKATGHSQMQISKNHGLANLVSLLEKWHNKIIHKLAATNPKFDDLVFEFEEVDNLDEKTQADIDQIYLMNKVILPSEIRSRDGLQPLSEEQLSELDNAEAQINIKQENQDISAEDKSQQEGMQGNVSAQKSATPKYEMFYKLSYPAINGKTNQN